MLPPSVALLEGIISFRVMYLLAADPFSWFIELIVKLSIVVRAAVMQGERSHQINEMLVPTLRCLVGHYSLLPKCS